MTVRIRTVVAAALAAVFLAAAGGLEASIPGGARGDAARPVFRLAPVPPAAEAMRLAEGGNPPFELTPAAGLFLGDPGPGAVRAKTHAGRAWLELGAFMTYSAVSYWIKYTKQGFIEDWQFQLNWHDQSRRFFTLQAWAFDSNNFKLNWTHNLAGAIYYQFARANGLSLGSSWLMAVAGSFFWEYVVEWKEVIAINDQITTGLGSYATGEPWFQFGRFLSREPGLVLRILSWLNPVVRLNEWLDRKDGSAGKPPSPGWHDLSLFAGARRLARAGHETETAAYFGFDARLRTNPDYGKPGHFRQSLGDTFFSRIALAYSVRGGRADETNLVTAAFFLGRFRQDLDESRQGFSLTFGLGSSFEYFKKRPVFYFDSHPVPVDPENPGSGLDLETPRDFTDKLADLHLAGPVVDWTLFRRGFTLRATAEAYLDFALVNALALNEYSAGHDILGMKTTVLYYGYYYGFGTTVAGSAELEWGNFRARSRLSFGAWGSADFRDRFQYDVTNNAHLKDTRFLYLAGVGWKIPRAPLEIFAAYEGLARWGKIEDVSVHGLEKRFYAGLKFSY